MFEKAARQILQTRREVDFELQDMCGLETDFQISSDTVDLDYVPGQFDRALRSNPASMEASTTVDLLETVVGLSRDEAEEVAYADIVKARQNSIDTSRHREPLAQIVRSAFGTKVDFRSANMSKAEKLDFRNRVFIPLIDSMCEFVENAIQDAKNLKEFWLHW